MDTNFKLSFDNIEQWATSTYRKIRKSKREIESKIKSIENNEASEAERTAWTASINDYLDSYNKFECSVENDVELISSLFRRIDQSGGFKEKDLLAFQAFQSIKNEIFLALTEYEKLITEIATKSLKLKNENRGATPPTDSKSS